MKIWLIQSKIRSLFNIIHDKYIYAEHSVVKEEICIQHSSTLIPAWMGNYIHYKLWGEVTYLSLNFKGVAFENLEWISNFITYFIDIIASIEVNPF